MVIPVTMDCMIICLADLPLPPAALRVMANLHFLHLKFIQCVRMIMKVRSLLFNLFLGIVRMPLYALVYASGLVSIFYRVDFSGIITLRFILSRTCLVTLVR